MVVLTFRLVPTLGAATRVRATDTPMTKFSPARPSDLSLGHLALFEICCFGFGASAPSPITGSSRQLGGGHRANRRGSVRQSTPLSSPMTMSAHRCRWCAIGPLKGLSRPSKGVTSPIKAWRHPANRRSGSSVGSRWECISSARNGIHCVISRSRKQPRILNRIH